MEIIAIGFGLSIVWHLGGLIFEVLGEILFMRLHKNKYYRALTGKEKLEPKKKNKKDNEITSVTNAKIGF